MKAKLAAIGWGMVGVVAALVIWRAYLDYQDFCLMRSWIASVQAAQAQAQKAQTAPATPDPAPPAK